MKKLLVLCLMIGVIAVNSVPVFADAPAEDDWSEISQTVKTFDDGSYMVVTLLELSDDLSQISDTETVSSVSKSGKKTVNHYSDNGDLLWTYVLYGKFSYVYGKSSVCTSSTSSNNIADSSWSLKSNKTWPDNDSAKASAVFVKKVLFVTTKTCNVELNIKCDIYGNLS